MSKAVQREDLIDQIDDLDVLRARLKAAERVCILSAWSPAPDRKWERGRLEYRYWSEWYAIAGEAAGPKENAEINRAVRDADARDAKYRKEAAVA